MHEFVAKVGASLEILKNGFYKGTRAKYPFLTIGTLPATDNMNLNINTYFVNRLYSVIIYGWKLRKMLSMK